MNSKKKPKIITKITSKKISSTDLALFTRQIATLTTAGIPLTQAFTVFTQGVSDTPLGNLVKMIKIDIESGRLLSSVLKKHPANFDYLYCSLIESAEQSGTLDIMLTRIANYTEKSESLKRKIKKALYYPSTILITSLIVTWVLLVKVVPTFKDIFKGFNADLPIFTVWVLNLSETLQEQGLYFLFGLMIASYSSVQCYRKIDAVKQFFDKFSLKLPIFGSILQKAIIARFARTLAITFASGVPLIESLDTVAEGTGNGVYTHAILKVKDALINGQPLRVAVKKTDLFPLMVVQLISIGEESGTLEKMFDKIASIYEEEVDTTIEGLTTLLEPLIIVIMGFIVGGLVVAMYLPIIKMGSIL